MTTIHQHNILISIIVVFMIALTACTKQNWYHGAQSAQTADCMKQPLSEYSDCNQQSREMSYDEYKNSREQLKNQKDKTDY